MCVFMVLLLFVKFIKMERKKEEIFQLKFMSVAPYDKGENNKTSNFSIRISNRRLLNLIIISSKLLVVPTGFCLS